MATWTVKINVVNLSAKQADVVGTRTDGVDIREYTLSRVSVDTHDKPLSQIRAEVVAKIYEKFQEDEVARAATVTLISGWEAALATDLNALET